MSVLNISQVSDVTLDSRLTCTRQPVISMSNLGSGLVNLLAARQPNSLHLVCAIDTTTPFVSDS